MFWKLNNIDLNIVHRIALSDTLKLKLYILTDLTSPWDSDRVFCYQNKTVTRTTRIGTYHLQTGADRDHNTW